MPNHKSRLSATISEDIKTLSGQGLSNSAVAKRLGCSLTTVQRIRKALGLRTSMKDVHARPGYRKQLLDRADSQEWRELHTRQQKEIWSAQSLRDKHSSIMKEVWMDDTYASTQRSIYTEEKKELQRRKQKEIWSSKEVRSRLLEERGTFPIVRPDIYAEWHHTRNDIDPMTLTPGAPVRVWWLCDRGHEWQAAVKDRTRRDGLASGCPHCATVCSSDETYI